MHKVGRISSLDYKVIRHLSPLFFICVSLLLSACDSGNASPSATTQVAQNTSVSTTSIVTSNATSSDTVTTINNTATTSSADVTVIGATNSPNHTSSASTTTTPRTTTTNPVTNPKPTVALNPDDQVLRMVGSDIPTLDPALASDTDSSFVVRQIFSGLVTLDNNLNVVPDLAATLPTISDDGKTYTFKLKSNATFASGKAITADDVKYSLERATDPKIALPSTPDTLPAANYMNDIVGVKDRLDGKSETIAGIKVLDRNTIQFQLDGPKPYFLDKMTFNCFFVVNPDNVTKGDNWFETPDPSGPFKLDEWSKGQLIRLTPNSSYANGAPYLKEVDILEGNAAASPLNLYDTPDNKIDMFDIGAGAEVERALDKNSPLNKELVVAPQLELTYLAFNNKAKPFDDPKIRQAFSLVVDRAKIARAMFENKVVEAKTILPPGLPGYSGNPASLTYDVSRARDLITQSSYKSSDNLPKILLYSTGSGLAGTLQAVFKQTLGVNIEVRQYEYKDFQAGLSQSQFQAYVYGWTADYPDPEDFLRALLGTNSPFNNTNYSNAQFDKLMQDGDQQSDPSKRFQFYQQAEQIALNDASLLPIYHDVSYMLIKPYVKNLVVTGEGIISLKDVYIQK